MARFQRQPNPKHYLPENRTWEKPELYASQQALLRDLPENANVLPPELMQINTGNFIHAFDDDGQRVATLTKSVAAAAFEYNQMHGGFQSRIINGEEHPGRLTEVYGISPTDAVIYIFRNGKNTFYKADTGERIKESADECMPIQKATREEAEKAIVPQEVDTSVANMAAKEAYFRTMAERLRGIILVVLNRIIPARKKT